LAALLDAVSAGEQITITRHGRPVARLVPPAAEAPASVIDTITPPASVQPGADPRRPQHRRAARSGPPMNHPDASGAEETAAELVLDVSLSCAWHATLALLRPGQP
jgi:antitoxin (DNA-binding transcriptional repressor) of toxin-antitoxin stability system